MNLTYHKSDKNKLALSPIYSESLNFSYTFLKYKKNGEVSFPIINLTLFGQIGLRKCLRSYYAIAKKG